MSFLQSVGWALVHFVWQGSAIAVVLAIALVAARRAPATFRYALSTGALLVMLVVPVGTVLRLRATPVIAPTPTDAAESRQSIVTGFVGDPATLVATAPTVASHNVQSAPRAGAEPAAVAAPSPSEHAPATSTSISLESVRTWVEQHMAWVVALWTLGVLLLSIRLLGGWLRARQLRTQGTGPVPDLWRRALERLAGVIGVAKPVEILESALVAMPVVIGWLRPVILLPGSVFTGLTTHQLEAILAHELAHIRRHDYLVNLAQSLIETVLFYHPGVWWVSRRVRDERENCCDDLAVGIVGDAGGYAAALVDMERLRGAALTYALGAGGGSLVARVRRLVAPVSHAETAPRWAAGAIAVVAALAVGGASGVPAAVAEIGAEPLTEQAGQAPDTVLKHPNPAAALAARWDWAQAEVTRRNTATYWIGYTVRPPASMEHLVYMDPKAVVWGDGISMSGRMFGDFRGLRFPGVALGPLVGEADPELVALLFEFRGGSQGRLIRVHASSFPLPVDLGGHTLIWLGAGDDAASLPLVERLYGTAATVDLKEQVIDALGIHGSSALVVPALERHMARTEPTRVRAHAAELLALHPVPPALQLLARTARTDPSSDVRSEAAEAVGEMPLPAATDTLVALARTLEDPEARREAVEGLGQRNDPRARSTPESIAREDRREDVQREAVETLGELEDGKGSATLRDLARQHPNADVRREALETLGQTLAPAEAVTILSDAARTDRNPDVQREAVETLGEVGSEAARAAVLAIARTHPHPDVRREAVETLGEAWPTDETVETLVKIARDDADVDVQREAVEMLGQVGSGMGIGAVVELAVTHPHPDVRREAIETVAENLTPDEALRVLRDVIRNDQNEDVRREAVETLGELHSAAAITLLKEVARSTDDPEVRREAVETIGEAVEGPQAATFLAAILNDDRSPDVQQEALETLMELPGGAGIPTVIGAARSHKSRDIRVEALKKLAESDDPRARAVFERALGTP